MKTALQFKDELKTVLNRCEQLNYDLQELGLELASLQRSAADLTERARVFTPPRQRDGYHFFDPSVDVSDPSEPLTIMKERLRRADVETLEHAERLLQERRETIRAIVG